MSEPVSDPQGSPLIGIADAGPEGMVTLRADLAAPAVAEAVRRAVGTAVPAPLTALFSGRGGAVWMSPDELLLRMPRDEAPGAVAALEAALAGTHHLVLDMSDARCLLRLTGPAVAEVLAKGAPVDLARFAPGTARRTHLGQIAAAFWRIDADLWEIVALRSYAHHLRAWLEAAARPGSRVGAL